jgi:hypothetical protein
MVDWDDELLSALMGRGERDILGGGVVCLHCGEGEGSEDTGLGIIGEGRRVPQFEMSCF